MALTTAQLSLIEQRVANDGPSTAVAYPLWFFLGVVSGHRWYLGRPGSGVLQILNYLLSGGILHASLVLARCQGSDRVFTVPT